MPSARTAVLVVLLGTCLAPPSAPARAQAPGAPAGSSSLPGVIPIFPLPDTSLFPNASARFHIFEPRYRAMIADALKGNRIIGMVTLQPGYEADYEGRPPIFPVGCAGLITSYEAYPDGRYDIILGGLVKFRVTGEDDSRPYRLARVAAVPEPLTTQAADALHEERQRIEQLLGALFDRLGFDQPPPGVPDEQVVDELSQYLPMPRPERLRLLELENPLARARQLTRAMEAMQAELSSPPPR